MNKTKNLKLSCHVCKSNNLSIIDGFSAFNQITSDCKLWKKGGKLIVCNSCLTVQKEISKTWTDDIKRIYKGYTIYHQGEGQEQKIFEKDSSAHSRSEKIISHLSTFALISNNGKLIDVGCGNGSFLRNFSKMFPNWKLSGLEYDDKYKNEVESIKNVDKLYTGDLETIKGKYDLISLIHVLEHIPNPKDYLLTIKNRLSDKGILLIEVPNYIQNPFDILIADHATHFSKETISNLLRSSGFEILSLSDSLINKELTILAKINGDVKRDILRIDSYRHVKANISWLEYMIKKAKEESKHCKFGIFGTSIGATFLFNEICDSVDFFIDEDPARIGKSYMGCQILSPKNIPKNSKVFMPFLPKLSNNIMLRIKKNNSTNNITWIILDDITGF